MNGQQPEDEELIKRTRRGQREAFGLLSERYRPLALALALRFTGNLDTARELTQESLLQAFLSLSRLRDTRHFKSWFTGIVLNVCRNHLRLQRQHGLYLDAVNVPLQAGGEPLLAGPQDSVFEQVQQRERQQQVSAALRGLSPLNREIMQQFYFEQRSHQEIAEGLHLSLVAVKSRLHTSRLRLRLRLELTYPELAATRCETTPMSRCTASRLGEQNMNEVKNEIKNNEIKNNEIKNNEIKNNEIKNNEIKNEVWINVKVVKVIENTGSQQQTAVLLDEAGQRGLPLWVSGETGNALAARLNERAGHAPAASGTYDLLARALNTARTPLEEVRIEQVTDSVFYGVLRLRRGKTTYDLQAQPGDALALALQMQRPIQVSETVLNRVGLALPVESGQVRELVHRVREWNRKAFCAPSGIFWPDYADQPHNLDFTSGLEGWAKSAANSDAPDYETGLDPQGRQAGIAVPFLANRVGAPDGYGTLMQNMRADLYRGKRLRMSAWLKTENVEQAAGMWLRLDMPHKTQAWNMTDAPVRGTTEWRQYAYVLDIPHDALGIAFGISLDGKGKIWADDFRFEIVGTTVPVTSSAYGEHPQPTNLDFADGIRGWWKGTSKGAKHRIGTDAMTTHEGKQSAFVRSEEADEDEWGMIAQNARIGELAGQQIKVSAWLKGDHILGEMRLWLRIEGEVEETADSEPKAHNVLCYEDTRNQSLPGTTGWRLHEMLLDAPPDSKTLHFGVQLYGSGQVWVSGIQIKPLVSKTNTPK